MPEIDPNAIATELSRISQALERLALGIEYLVEAIKDERGETDDDIS